MSGDLVRKMSDDPDLLLLLALIVFSFFRAL